ncbi:DUF6950 family protein [Opitutus terrae]|uniref:DUF6950 domain-containing protein n=1 Tax=Opitutus terrae (strain DSM 11246 / JCM 15787 / PB90-1) TaxID=452637 RepID=B1ZV46_OPITP|nr:hypothetical protein [Opitutus terrae]ACB76713.1 conserved hypothetical protein [Opitutus terrae PB90-1]
MSKPRLQNWPTALAAYLTASRTKKFAWGEHDCCLFSAGAIAAQTGEDPAAELRGTYHTAKEATALIRTRYEGSLWNVPEQHGLRLVDVRHAGRGDIVGDVLERRRILGVCAGARSAFLTTRGLVWRDTLACRFAWRIA